MDKTSKWHRQKKSPKWKLHNWLWGLHNRHFKHEKQTHQDRAPAGEKWERLRSCLVRELIQASHHLEGIYARKISPRTIKITWNLWSRTWDYQFGFYEYDNKQIRKYDKKANCSSNITYKQEFTWPSENIEGVSQNSPLVKNKNVTCRLPKTIKVSNWDVGFKKKDKKKTQGL